MRPCLPFLLVLAALVPCTPAFPVEPVNVVLILADDLGYGDLACYGHPQFRTPRLDRMAREGAKLTHFAAPCPFCAPTRASLLTGRYPFRHGLTGNPVPKEDYGRPNPLGDLLGLNPSELTLGEVFQAAGYGTACIGKWHLGHQPKFLPTRNGFDEYFGIPYSNDMHPVALYDGEKQVEFPVPQTTLTQRYTERALSFVERHRDGPFFLYWPHAMPHKPLAASEAFAGKSGAGLYGDVIAELDASVGKLLDKLDELQLAQRTLVLFTSDNGPWYGGSTGGLRGMKSLCWEGGLRVPLLARWPGKIPAGHVSDQPAVMPDLFATALAATELKPPAVELDGRNILPLLTSQAKSPHAAIFGVQGKIRTVRSGSWKLHLSGTPTERPERDDWVDPRAPNGTTILAPAGQYGPRDYPGVRTGDHSTTRALFDLAADPSEQHDVAAQHPEVVARLLAAYDEVRTEETGWKKHVVHAGEHTNTAVGGDFTGDGRPDVIANSAGKTRLFVAPDWREIVLHEGKDQNFIHSEAFDVDGDGDLDFLGARYSPGLIVWLEQPDKPLTDRWPVRLVDDQVNGIHGLLQGDVDGDGRPDLLANSGQPVGPFANSAAWLRVPKNVRQAERWERHIFAAKDAAGLSHYFGFGDVNGDGRPDAALAAKGGPQAEPGTGAWFAWWEAPADPTQPWKKHLLADHQEGATNIQPADVNGDGRVDFVATRGHARGVLWFEAPDWKRHEIDATLLEPHCLQVRDLDGDGDLDVATCGYGDRLAYWYENDGHGRFRAHLVARDQAAYDIRAVDLDRDGDLDLLIAGQQSKNVAWYANPARQPKAAE